MLLKPDCTTAYVDQFCERPTLALICDVVDPILRQPYSRDPRYVAREAEIQLAASEVAHTCFFGPELEFRCPDPSANAYLAFAAMLMAGLDGIEHRIDPGDPLDKNIYDLSPGEASNVRQVPGSLDESSAALEADQAFLRRVTC